MKFLRGLWQGWREFWALSWWGKGPVLVTLALLLIIAIASGGGGSGDAASDGDGPSVEEAARELLAKTPKAAPTVLVTREPAPSPVIVVPSPTVIAQKPEPTEAPPGLQTTFGGGMQLVGVDISAGTYRAGGGGGDCYWERLSGLSGTGDEIITNYYGSGQPVVAISPSDVAFDSTGCGTWARID